MNALSALFLDCLIKSFVVLALAGTACFGLRRASAATRYWIWFLAIAGLPFLPLLSSILPSWQKPLWAVTRGFSAGNQVSLTLRFTPSHQSTNSNRKSPTPASTPATPAESSNSVPEPLTVQMNAFWPTLVFIAWLAGVMLNLHRILLSQIQLRSLARNSQAVTDIEWVKLLRQLREELGLRHPVKLLQGNEQLMPLTWGWWRPVILLPATANQWFTDRRRIVLLHELAHVKRWDCLTQVVAGVICAFFWFNPLVWLANSRMRVERERAADDLVLNAGCKASDYATHLVEIATTFRQASHVTAIAMARASKLGDRVSAICDVSCRRRPLSSVVAGVYCAAVFGIMGCIAAQKMEVQQFASEESRLLRQQHLARLKAFAKAKEQQALALAAKAKVEIIPEYRRFLDASIQGDWKTVTNMYESFLLRHPQFGKDPAREDEKLNTRYWPTIHELCLAYDRVINTEPKYLQLEVDEMMKSIPSGCIYFGGTDAGRALPTAFSKSHAAGDPFFTLTQNSMADGDYLLYLRDMYDGRIYTPTDEDQQKCYQEYLDDAQQRLKENKLKPGEDVQIVGDHVQVRGQVAVMSIGGLVTKTIFDKNPGREFYVEESFPLDWMYPHLTPHGLIMRINRQPQARISDDALNEDRKYWSTLVAGMLGDWLTPETTVAEVQQFVERVHVKGNLSGFKGDSRFIQNDQAMQTFSKFRSSIGGLYSWRAQQAKDPTEKIRMLREAEFAFRQAWVMSPSSPEAIFRYVNVLVIDPQFASEARLTDAKLITDTALRLPQLKGDRGSQVRELATRLRNWQPPK